MGGNKRGNGVLILAVLLVFFTSGLWHGANTTMIIFGVSQGLLYLFDRFVFKRLDFIGGPIAEEGEPVLLVIAIEGKPEDPVIVIMAVFVQPLEAVPVTL